MDQERISDIYDTLQGVLVESACVPGVENLFELGTNCDQWYCQMLDAYGRLCARLGVADGDSDVEIIIHSLMAIGRELSFHMYRCGARFGIDESSG
ncbi:MAG: hypothetical protein IJX69_01710 [Oscillospiraceae bacterium]|nr:hypothetical protein [Oscillospiraceae bacterium]